MELKVNGFSHKLPLLLEQLVKALVSLKVGKSAPAMTLPQLPTSSASLTCPFQLLLADLNSLLLVSLCMEPASMERGAGKLV